MPVPVSQETKQTLEAIRTELRAAMWVFPGAEVPVHNDAIEWAIGITNAYLRGEGILQGAEHAKV